MFIELKNYVQNKDTKKLRSIIEDLTPSEIVEQLEHLSKQEKIIFFRLITSDKQSEIFAALEPEEQEDLISAFTDKEIKDIIGDLYTNDLADLIEEIPEEMATRIMKLAVDNDTKTSVHWLLQFEEDQIGSLMYIDILKVRSSWTVAQALKYVKQEKENVKIGHHIFIVDDKGVLEGYIVLEDLIFTNEKTKIKTLMKPASSVTTTMNKEEAAQTFAVSDMSTLPVVNSQEQLIGIITADDVIDIISESIDEDIQIQANIVYNEESYTETSIWKSFYSRVFWLIVIMIAMTFSSIFIDNFIKNIESNDKFVNSEKTALSAMISTALVAITLVTMDSAGNAAGQSSSLVIRALATGDINAKDYWKVISKETSVAFLSGLTLAIVNIIRLIAYYAIDGTLFDHPSIAYGLAFGSSISLFIIIIIAKFLGGTVPLIAKLCRMDPALLSGPIAISLIDIIANVTLFSITISIVLSVM